MMYEEDDNGCFYCSSESFIMRCDRCEDLICDVCAFENQCSCYPRKCRVCDYRLESCICYKPMIENNKKDYISEICKIVPKNRRKWVDIKQNKKTQKWNATLIITDIKGAKHIFKSDSFMKKQDAKHNAARKCLYNC